RYHADHSEWLPAHQHRQPAWDPYNATPENARRLGVPCGPAPPGPAAGPALPDSPASAAATLGRAKPCMVPYRFRDGGGGYRYPGNSHQWWHRVPTERVVVVSRVFPA